MRRVTSVKPYGIANRGAAGVDDETIADFERTLSRDSHKLWRTRAQCPQTGLARASDGL